MDALHGLRSIYDSTENWTKLVDVLKKEQAIATDDRIDITFDLAETERLHLNQTSEAIQLYADILNEDASHERTISTLEGLIHDGVEPCRLAEILEPVYERAGEYAKQCEALEIRLKSLEKDDKIPVLWQIYDLRHDVLKDETAAFDVSVRQFALASDDERIWDNLETLAKSSDNDTRWSQISMLYADVAVDEDHNDEWRFKLLRRRAAILEEQLSKEAESIELWEQIHENAPEDSEAIQHLENLYKNSSSFEKLVKLYEFETNLSDASDDDRIRINLEAAQIYEDILEKPEEAIRIYRAVLDIDSSRNEALTALERLYSSNEMWTELAALYEDELNIYSDAENVSAIRTKLADVSNEHLSNYERAIECYEALLNEDHKDETISAANSLLQKLVSVEGDKIQDYRTSLCGILEPIFVEKSNLNDLISLLRIKLNDTDDSYDKVELNRRIANILKDDLSDDKGAFDALSAALKIDVADESLRSDFENLAAKLERPNDIISLYEESLNSVEDDMLKHDLLKRIASIHENDLQDSTHAIEAYRRMLDIDDMDSESINALENLYTNEQNWTELINILKRKTDIVSGDEKVDILRKMATINGDCINNTKAAIDCYREILDNVSDDRDALNALESLYAQTEDWENLSENYGVKLQLTSDDNEKHTILKEMARIQENNLKHYDEATQLHVQILDIFPEDEEAMDALERLYQGQEAYDDLADILRRKLALHKDSDIANEIEYRLGQVNQTKLNAVDDAIEHYKAILDRKPEHAEAHDALRGLLDNEDYRINASKVLESVYDRTEQNEKLAEILEIQLADESDPYSQVEFLKRIATIHQDKLSNYPAAFKDLARILKINQEDCYIDQIESLSDILNNTSELVDVYKDVVTNIYEPDQQVSFNNKIADLLRNNLNDEAQSEKYYRAALEAQNDDAQGFC